MRHAAISFVLCSALLAFAAQKPTPQFDFNEGVALALWKGDEERPRTATVRSPDGRRTIAVQPGRGNKPVITITSNGKVVRHHVEYMSQAWLLWSPGSNAFLIESTSTGSYDGWKVQVFAFNDNQLQEFDVSQEARKDLALAFPPCIPGDELNRDDCGTEHWGDEFNVHAVKWMTGDRLLIIAAIPCSTAYGPNWCKLKAYEVEVPSGRILAGYTHAEAHHRYPTLVTPEKSHIIGLTGWAKIEDDKTVFIGDEGKQRWTISNPEALKCYAGHHVKVKGHIILEDNSLEITTVKVVDEAKHDGADPNWR